MSKSRVLQQPLLATHARILGSLLAAGSMEKSISSEKCEVWHREGIYRSETLLRIYNIIRTGADRGSVSRYAVNWDWRVAVQLTKALNMLPSYNRARPQQCDLLLSNTCELLRSLQRPVDRKFTIVSVFESFSVEVVKLRAVVLICINFVISTMESFIRDSNSQEIHITIENTQGNYAVLTMTDPNVSLPACYVCEFHQVMVNLATLLKAEISYQRRLHGGYRITLRFIVHSEIACPASVNPKPPSSDDLPPVPEALVFDTLKWLSSKPKRPAPNAHVQDR
jgi:hypothetical protein